MHDENTKGLNTEGQDDQDNDDLASVVGEDDASESDGGTAAGIQPEKDISNDNLTGSGSNTGPDNM